MVWEGDLMSDCKGCDEKAKQRAAAVPTPKGIPVISASSPDNLAPAAIYVPALPEISAACPEHGGIVQFVISGVIQNAKLVMQGDVNFPCGCKYIIVNGAWIKR